MTLLKKIGINKAVLIGLLIRGWAIGSGIISVFVIALFFSKELQGYFFTFQSLIAVQVLTQLAFSVAIIHFASHEWAELNINKKGEIYGNFNAFSRLQSLAKTSIRTFVVLALISSVGYGVIGYFCFSNFTSSGINWFWPWTGLCVVNFVDMLLISIKSFLEGCNQMSQMYISDLFKQIIRILAIWILIILGGKLWASAGAILLAIIWTVFYFIKYYSSYFKSLFVPVNGPRLNWKKEIWPIQWKIGFCWLSGLFYPLIFSPIIFVFRGAVEAGRIGMTVFLVSALSLSSFMWISTRAPKFGELAAKKKYKELNKVFFISIIGALLIALFGSIVIFSFIFILYLYNLPFSLRFIPPMPTLILLAATVLMQISYAQSYYLRAHKSEPFISLYLVSTIILFTMIFLTVDRWGVLGVTISYFAVVFLWIVPVGTIIWYRCRKKWHSKEYKKTDPLIGLDNEPMIISQIE
ncbi:hypothetical protein ACFL31_01570 [Candidatus Margulisiibacteriota bacterium]